MVLCPSEYTSEHLEPVKLPVTLLILLRMKANSSPQSKLKAGAAPPSPQPLSWENIVPRAWKQNQEDKAP